MSGRVREFASKVKRALDFLVGAEGFYRRHEAYLVRIQATMAESLRSGELRANPRYAKEKCLTRHGLKVFWQNDEDGIIEEVLRRVGCTNRFFAEIGAGSGTENNSLYLLARGYSGVWLEADAASIREARKNLSSLLKSGRLSVVEAAVTAENAEGLLTEAKVPDEFDLLSIDVDGNDYWIWKAVRKFSPRVVVIEYNAGLGPSVEWVILYDSRRRWDGTLAFGASLKALERLAREKGYSLVGCNFTGVNAFFVRSDLVADRFLPPHTSETHFEPARYHVQFQSPYVLTPAAVSLLLGCGLREGADALTPARGYFLRS